MPYYIWFALQKKKEKNKASKINGLEIAKYFWIVSRRELVIYTSLQWWYRHNNLKTETIKKKNLLKLINTDMITNAKS